MFRDMIAADFNVPVPTTDVEDEALMLLMWENMKTHSNESLKMSRWFSWMRQYRSRRRIWHSKLAVLTFWEQSKGPVKDKHALPSTSEALVPHTAMLHARDAKTIKEELHKLRQASINSLALARKLMTEESRDLGAVITECVQPLWSFGAKRAAAKVTPRDNVNWSRDLANTWQGLLCDTVQHAFQRPESLSYMGFSGDASSEESLQSQDQLATYVFEFVTHLLARKGLSLCRTHWKPPWSFAALLSEVCC